MNVREMVEGYDIGTGYNEGYCSIAGAFCLEYLKPTKSLEDYYTYPSPVLLAQLLSTINTRIGEQLILDISTDIVDACGRDEPEKAINRLQEVIDYEE